MFWQGGGKKRMQGMIGSRMQSNHQAPLLENITVARTDDQLMFLYYHRTELGRHREVEKEKEREGFNIWEKEIEEFKKESQGKKQQKAVEKKQKFSLFYSKNSILKQKNENQQVLNEQNQQNILTENKQNEKQINQRNLFRIPFLIP